jgi:hypothetical protein
VVVLWSVCCCCCCPSVNTLCGRNKVGFVVGVCRQLTKYVDILWFGLSLASFSKHNAWSYLYYGCIRRWCHESVNTICFRIMVGFIVVVVRQ